MQFVGGVHSRSYWIAAYVKDSLVNLFVLTVTMILFGSIQTSGFTGRNLGAVFLLFVSRKRERERYNFLLVL